LRNALEPAGQPLEGRAVYGCDEAGEDEAGAQFALVLAEEGYTANVPLADLLRRMCCLRSNMTVSHWRRNTEVHCA